MKRISSALLALLLAFGMLISTVQTAYAQNEAPIAENLELSTYRNSSVGGKLTAHDAEGGELEFIICTEPVKGSVVLEKDGSFVYTPREGKRGRDYFGYKVRDAEGNLSQEATVIIRIEKQSKDVSYSDMTGRAEEYAALLLSEREIYTAEMLGGEYCFSPDRPVSRGEFISICMLISGDSAERAVLNTGYTDNELIPAWMRGHAVEASLMGIYRGRAGEKGLEFAPNETISRAEAALLLERTIAPAGAIAVMEGESNTAAVSACINLDACGVPTGGAVSPDMLTRAEMAAMIAAALKFTEQ